MSDIVSDAELNAMANGITNNVFSVKNYGSLGAMVGDITSRTCNTSRSCQSTSPSVRPSVSLSIFSVSSIFHSSCLNIYRRVHNFLFLIGCICFVAFWYFYLALCLFVCLFALLTFFYISICSFFFNFTAQTCTYTLLACLTIILTIFLYCLSVCLSLLQAVMCLPVRQTVICLCLSFLSSRYLSICMYVSFFPSSCSDTFCLSVCLLLSIQKANLTKSFNFSMRLSNTLCSAFSAETDPGDSKH